MINIYPALFLCTGLCLLTGVCNKNPDQDNKKTSMKNKFDHWGSVTAKDYKYNGGPRDTTGSASSCHERAEEVFKQCGNDDSQAITAAYTLNDGTSKPYTFPPPGKCLNNKYCSS